MYETFNGPIARAEDFQNVEGLPDTLHGPYQKLLRGAAKSRLNPKVQRERERKREHKDTETQAERERDRHRERTNPLINARALTPR